MAKSAEELLIYLFDEILPKHGMNCSFQGWGMYESDGKMKRL